MKTEETAVGAVPFVFDRALTDVIRSRRLLAQTERQLAEAVTILRTIDGTAAGAERVTEDLDLCIGRLVDVQGSLGSMLDRLAGD